MRSIHVLWAVQTKAELFAQHKHSSCPDGEDHRGTPAARELLSSATARPVQRDGPPPDGAAAGPSESRASL